MGTPRRDRTSDDVESELASKLLPGGAETWLHLVERHARRAGARLEEVCQPGRRTLATVRARHGAWAELRALGYSYPEIAEPWGADHTTVMDAVKKLLAKEAA